MCLFIYYLLTYLLTTERFLAPMQPANVECTLIFYIGFGTENSLVTQDVCLGNWKNLWYFLASLIAIHQHQ